MGRRVDLMMMCRVGAVMRFVVEKRMEHRGPCPRLRSTSMFGQAVARLGGDPDRVRHRHRRPDHPAVNILTRPSSRLGGRSLRPAWFWSSCRATSTCRSGPSLARGLDLGRLTADVFPRRPRGGPSDRLDRCPRVRDGPWRADRRPSRISSLRSLGSHPSLSPWRPLVFRGVVVVASGRTIVPREDADVPADRGRAVGLARGELELARGIGVASRSSSLCSVAAASGAIGFPVGRSGRTSRRRGRLRRRARRGLVANSYRGRRPCATSAAGRTVTIPREAIPTGIPSRPHPDGVTVAMTFLATRAAVRPLRAHERGNPEAAELGGVNTSADHEDLHADGRSIGDQRGDLPARLHGGQLGLGPG